MCSITAFDTKRHILDVAHAAHGARTPRGSVHATGVEFDYAFFVRNSAQAYCVVIGIVFRTFHYFEGRVECVAAVFQEGISVLEIRIAVIGTNDNGSLVRSRLHIMFLRDRIRLGVFAFRWRPYSGGDCSED